MTYQTKEEVEVDWVKTYIKNWAFRQDRERLETFCDAYLALREELESYKRACSNGQNELVKLQADNQRLRDEVEAERANVQKLHGILAFSEQTTCMLLDRSRQLEKGFER